MTTANENHYCMLPLPAPMVGKPRAAVLNDAKWSAGSRITVGFTEGAASLRERVEKVAAEWTGPQMANLRLHFTEVDGADIRISFQQGNGSWSYLGIQSRDIPAAQPTMNYGWLTPESSDDELQRVVAHEFGHALGLIHEHQNPKKPIDWNRAAVIADLSQPPNDWDVATIENNIFKQYDPAEVTATETDKLSIMMYPIPAAWTNDGFSAGLNAEISDCDRALIRDAYKW